MFTCSWIFGIVVFSAVALPGRVLAQPSLFPPNITTCEKFEISARFNPYALIDSMWKIFYFWSNNTELTPIVFSLAAKTLVQVVTVAKEPYYDVKKAHGSIMVPFGPPTFGQNQRLRTHVTIFNVAIAHVQYKYVISRVKKFREVYEAVSGDTEVEWEKATLFMNAKPGTEVLFIYAATPGAFRAIVKKEQRNKARPNPEPLFMYADVRMKLVERYLGMMCCEDLTAYGLARMMEVPKTEEACKRAADAIGYHGYEGRSYLQLMAPDNDEF